MGMDASRLKGAYSESECIEIAMTEQDTIDLYLKAIELAKEREGLTNQEKMILNRFKILLRNDAVDEANREFAQIGKVTESALHKVRELAESIYEDWVRSLSIDEEEREQMLEEGKRRADVAENLLLDTLKMQGLLK